MRIRARYLQVCLPPSAALSCFPGEQKLDHSLSCGLFIGACSPLHSSRAAALRAAYVRTVGAYQSGGRLFSRQTGGREGGKASQQLEERCHVGLMRATSASLGVRAMVSRCKGPCLVGKYWLCSAVSRHALHVGPVSVPTSTSYPRRRLVSELDSAPASKNGPQGAREETPARGRRHPCGPVGDSTRPVAGTRGRCLGPKRWRQETLRPSRRPRASSRAPHHFCCTSNESLRRINKALPSALCHRGPTSRRKEKNKNKEKLSGCSGEAKPVFNKSSPKSRASVQAPRGGAERLPGGRVHV